MVRLSSQNLSELSQNSSIYLMSRTPRKILQSIHQPINARNKIQFTISIKLLHFSAPGCNHQGFFYNKGICSRRLQKCHLVKFCECSFDGCPGSLSQRRKERRPDDHRPEPNLHSTGIRTHLK
jgi:hypothetical protein